jgi:bacteriocin biosynthesis cyclodehydratase domain-containing protein
MATAFPVKGAGVLPDPGISLTVMGAGLFGERVARHLLSTYAHADTVAAPDLRNAFAGTRDAVVVALWRPEPALCELADELSHRHHRPWLPVIMEHRVIYAGPLVSPHSPCFRCYRRRREQHDIQPAATAALLAAYAGDPAAGPGGWLPHHARLAAGVAGQMLRTLAEAGPGRREDRGGGQVATIRLLGGSISLSPVVACHDCDRCGGPPGPAGGLDAVLTGFRARKTKPAQDRGAAGPGALR